MLDFLLRPIAAIPLLLLPIYAIYRSLSSKPNLPDLPWIGLRKEWFAKIRCRWRTTVNYHESVQRAYQEFSLKGRACIVPSIFRDLVLVPPTAIEWIISQPDEVLNANQIQVEDLQTDHTFSDPMIARQPYHEHVIRTELRRQLGNLTMDIMDELAVGLEETWGIDTKEWKSIGVYDSMFSIIARSSTRIFVGLPLCRSDSFLSLAKKLSLDVIYGAVVLRDLPGVLRPVFAPLLTLPKKYRTRKLLQYLEPEIQSRLSSFDSEKDGSQLKFNDFLQWTINDARTRLSNKAQEMTSHMLAGRIAALNFAAFHTSTFSITNTILDLASSDPSLHYLEQLREEAASVLAEEHGTWTKGGLSRMYKIDSALRESLRLHSTFTVGMVRKVVAEGGITTPAGLHVPCGAHVAVSVLGIHNDENNYTNPATYDALRFVKRNSRDAGAQLGDDNYLKKARFSMVSTSAEYQAFGHGRHACPGRFFAADELRLLLAYVVLNYEIEPLVERPNWTHFTNMSLPPVQATIRVRRR